MSVHSQAAHITNHDARPSIELHIGELVLDGFPAIDRAHLGALVQRELTRLFAERGVPPSLTQGGEIPRIDGGSLPAASGLSTQAIGTEIAAAVYRGLSP